jgi:hypothetical protein
MTDIEAIRAYLEARGHGAAHSYVGLHSHEKAVLRDELEQAGASTGGDLIATGAAHARAFLAQREAEAAAEAAAEHAAWLASRRAIAAEEGRVFEEPTP